MSSKKHKKVWFFPELFNDFKCILGDIWYMYKNFLHWNISKIIIFIWGLMLGVIIASPILLITIIVGLIDPISWGQIAAYGLWWTDPSLELIASLTQHPFWLSVMIFLIIATLWFFFSGTAYGIFLLARLSLKYIERKRLSYTKNLYFSKQHIRSFFAMVCWGSLYLLIPPFIGLVLIALVYSQNTSISLFQNLTIIVILWVIIIWVYMIYRVIFSYLILADQKKSEAPRSGKYYIASSRTLTQWKNFWKFLFILGVYMLFMSPFNSYEQYLNRQMQYMWSALAYKTGQISNIDESEKKYYEFISANYKDMENNELQESITAVYRISILYTIIMYLVFWGLFIMTLSSFYKRVLLQET